MHTANENNSKMIWAYAHKRKSVHMYTAEVKSSVCEQVSACAVQTQREKKTYISIFYTHACHNHRHVSCVCMRWCWCAIGLHVCSLARSYAHTHTRSEYSGVLHHIFFVFVPMVDGNWLLYVKILLPRYNYCWRSSTAVAFVCARASCMWKSLTSYSVRVEHCVRISEILQWNRTYDAFCVCSFTKRTFNLFFFSKTKSIISFMLVSQF